MSRHLVVGRGSSCRIRLTDPGISAAHAEFTWMGNGWCVRDLGSRNGTFVNGARIDAGTRAELRPGAEIGIGSRRLRIVDMTAPQLFAYAGDEQRVGSENMLFLPSEENPSHIIHLDRDARWVVESEAEIRPLSDGDEFIAGGRSWSLSLPGAIIDTITAQPELSLTNAQLRFVVSRDEEHIEMCIAAPNGENVVEIESRAHLALVLVLARTRLADTQNLELSASEHGWVHRDDLRTMLAVEPELIHVWIHRARKQLASHGIRDSAWIVERRAGGSQLRIGISNLVVHKR